MCKEVQKPRTKKQDLSASGFSGMGLDAYRARFGLGDTFPF